MKKTFIYRANVSLRLCMVLAFAASTLFFNSCAMKMCPTYFKADSQKDRGQVKTYDIYAKYHTKKPKAR